MMGRKNTFVAPSPMYVGDVEMNVSERSAQPPLIAIRNSSVAAEMTELWLVED